MREIDIPLDIIILEETLKRQKKDDHKYHIPLYLPLDDPMIESNEDEIEEDRGFIIINL